MTTITLTSRWFERTLKLRVKKETARLLTERNEDGPLGMERVRDDLERYNIWKALGKRGKCNLRYLKVNQCRRILSFFAEDDCNYFDKVELELIEED